MTMIGRIIIGTLFSVLAVTGGLLASAPPTHAATTSAHPTASPVSLVVYGPNRQALIEGIDYWNRLAGHDVLEYGGITGAADPHTVQVEIGELPTRIAGLTSGNVAVTPLTVTIAPAFADNWVDYAHEFGHTLGIGHDDNPTYSGVMHSTLLQAQQINSADDSQFV